MRPEACEAELLRRLAAMPFLDRLEMAAVSGRSRGAVYEAVKKAGGVGRLLASVPTCNSPIIPPTRRYCLTATGLHRLARDEGMTVDELLARCPCLRAGAARPHGETRLSSRRLPTRHRYFQRRVFPIRFRWYRAMPMDASMTLPDGRTVAVVRQGLTAGRTAFSKRLWRLREKFRPSAVLLLVPDEVRLRHARRLMAGAPSIAFLALERDAAIRRSQRSHLASAVGTGAPRPPNRPVVREAARSMARPRKPPSKVFLPGEISLEEPEHEVLQAGFCPRCSSPPRREPSTCSPTGPGSRPPTWESCWE